MKRSSLTSPAASTAELLAQLHEITLRLKVVYSTCVTAQLALEGSNSEQDRDIARCLRLGVSEAVTRQVDRIETMIEQVCGTMQESPT
jgi:hypothetical protein